MLVKMDNMKKIIEIPIHSFIATITNSSSEMFITASNKSVEMIKELLQKIIELSGSAKKVDELFDVCLTINEGIGYCPACEESLKELQIYFHEEAEECLLCGYNNPLGSYGDFDKRLEEGKIHQDVIDILIGENENKESPFSMSVSIFSKTTEGIDIGKDLSKLFEQKERCC